MSLKSSIAANYASQLYTTLIGIVLVPLYLRYMGSEAYGLIGFFAMLQAWFNLNPAVDACKARQVAVALADSGRQSATHLELLRSSRNRP